ncbi:hypothetical protein CBM2586_B10035 [Cupriavidus phytorum]|uniref:Uncharacterized protein n=1 Tax=Cupriavidus taiwanensis TaxID=164546 RepID=A0A375C8B3_9BURK|nr:hypothetical protein CBM2586_B10035 [Cupriavidus taiwanensis]
MVARTPGNGDTKLPLPCLTDLPILTETP